MNADLHFHPSFFSRGDKPHITERETPSLADILRNMDKKVSDILTITSCSTASHIDRRWSEYTREVHDLDQTVLNGEEFGENFCDNSNGMFFNRKRGYPATTIPLYLLHGQEFKTDKGDINVIGAESRVPIENSNGDFYWMLDASRNSGQNVLITIPHPARGLKIDADELKKLYEEGKIDALEMYDSMDTASGNRKSMELTKSTNIPGIAVSDGHRLKDMRRARIFIEDPSHKISTYEELTRYIKNSVKSRSNYISLVDQSPITSRILYISRLANAVLFPQF